jgi:hypothetical protein
MRFIGIRNTGLDQTAGQERLLAHFTPGRYGSHRGQWPPAA